MIIGMLAMRYQIPAGRFCRDIIPINLRLESLGFIKLHKSFNTSLRTYGGKFLLHEP
jgi:hypothetical protein